jgi:polyhydroxyalkanoate synthesis repressor PhaR
VAIPVIIHKYPNRRLYDTALSKYIHLADIHVLVAAHREFMVIDTQSGQDITRETLLLVLTSLDLGSGSILTKPFLLDLIRVHGTPQHAGIANALDEGAKQAARDPAITGDGSRQN